ncbi:MAG: hypothetical protein A2W28_08725 [Gammaproteobacteria bacterium RBG_16_51_14]|nr:MAG: hypothetical protein A2W28_08725 [Gammaproteobacteria bacterium RBG_16_51_14]
MAGLDHNRVITDNPPVIQIQEVIPAMIRMFFRRRPVQQTAWKFFSSGWKCIKDSRRNRLRAVKRIVLP